MRVRRIVFLVVAACALRPALRPVLALAQSATPATECERLSDERGLCLAPTLERHPAQPGQHPAVFVSGLLATQSDGADVAAKGDAELRRASSAIKADALHYSVDSDVADAYGHVRIADTGNVFLGPEAHLRVEANQGYITVPKYRFTMTNGWGSAKRIDLVDQDRFSAHEATYSTCACEARPDWYLTASRFDVDNASGTGVARDGVLFFEGVPLFASPWLSFPLSNERRSGLLAPTFSLSSSNGYDLTLPYYLNLAPNYDLTLTPRLMSKRGALLDANYRYLGARYSGEFNVLYLPDDALTKTKRYSIALRQDWTIASGLSAYVNYNRVSDATVATDLGGQSSYSTTSTTLYQQEAGIVYSDGPWTVLAREQHWQSFTDSSTYNRDPQINVRYAHYDLAGFDFGAQADVTRFTIATADATQGSRFVFDPYVSYSIVRPGWFLTPKLQWHFASYDLTSIGADAPSGQPKTFNANVPTLSLDSGMRFERPVRLFGHAFVQTLEPRLYYVYTPYRDQRFAPLFDTAEADLGLAEIFTSNSFIGNDRVSDTHRVTAALTTRFIEPESGEERARFVLAQQYDFHAPRVTLTDGAAAAEAARTNLIVGASYRIGAGVSAEQSLAYSQVNHYLSRATVGFGWTPAERHVLNAAYRYNRGTATLDDTPVNQFVVSSQWPVFRGASGVARLNYDLVTHRLIAGLVGFQYDADCWAIGLALEKYTQATSSSSASSGTRVLMQLQLKGLSKVDNGLASEFAQRIPGYTATSSPASQSPFSDYP
ncbi:LPS-assembly protein LptD [Trinickia caryophylli]|uniref:LPS-assembly protein LptD n=1 Tax=Trinickia caryophylli TaxID=28094 RepID=A0A1X7D841_TRICW|nr:LPS-assembly protein LptD [Trinickia caryophylli]PMS12652.1 LPS-assembly protein LptD [Trinickia caryophylli]TRX15058.1 LPS-assembly protein LptD [Trinickia caryophylli]WQE14917.1 LPS-assembly protein LptD [Trinickia caryophylli]SMF10158.1 LPS-assembly protein [Trinickia caryophylli]GLU31356.1 LPS-assembly protein LptD [Trinickia caryophylli]